MSQISMSELLDVFSPSLRNASNIIQAQTNRNLKFPIDIVNEEKTIYIYAEVPGIDKNDIDVDFFNNKLTISFDKNRSYEPPQTTEIKFGKFERTITLPICITKRETVSVVYNNGVLKIKINKLVEEENKFSVKVDTV